MFYPFLMILSIHDFLILIIISFPISQNSLPCRKLVANLYHFLTFSYKLQELFNVIPDACPERTLSE